MNITADVIVIGSGVVGNAAAYYLAKRGRKVIVLEAKIILDMVVPAGMAVV